MNAYGLNLPDCPLSARTQQAEDSLWSHMETSPYDPEPRSGPEVGSRTEVALDRKSKHSEVRKINTSPDIQRYHAIGEGTGMAPVQLREAIHPGRGGSGVRMNDG